MHAYGITRELTILVLVCDLLISQGDDWTLVDKSPTFESVAEGKTELGGESWFVQDREQS